MKTWIGVLVSIIFVGVLGWYAKSLFPLPSSSPVPSPASTRRKIPQMPPPQTSQAPEPATEQSASAQNPEPATEQTANNPTMETPAIQGDQTAGEVQNATTESVASSQGAMEANTSAPVTPPHRVDLADEKEAVNESQPMPEPAPTVAAAEAQPAPPTEVAPPAPALPETENEAAPQAATPPDDPQPRVEVTAPPPEPAAASPESDRPAPFNIQVGAYLTKTYADDKLHALLQLGYDAFIFRATDTRQRTWYAVRFGRFATREEAVRSLTEFKANQSMDAIISRSGSL